MDILENYYSEIVTAVTVMLAVICYRQLLFIECIFLILFLFFLKHSTTDLGLDSTVTNNSPLRTKAKNGDDFFEDLLAGLILYIFLNPFLFFLNILYIKPCASIQATIQCFAIQSDSLALLVYC